MAEENKVRLHGTWVSTFVRLVKLALEIKGIQYEYVEEDLKNNNLVLLKYNPIHKELGSRSCFFIHINMLVKNSFLNSCLFVFETMMLVLKSDREAQEKATKEVSERVIKLEEEIKNIFPEGIQVIDQKNVGLLDLVIVSTFGYYKAREEYLGLKLIDPEKTPFYFLGCQHYLSYLW
ncbi:hypothetical protein ACJW31_04G109700 [Castanea mollissima]